MKKLINDPGTVVADALRGIEAAHPGTLKVDTRTVSSSVVMLPGPARSLSSPVAGRA
jgi:dihydroxyacetone kinase